MNTGVYKIKNEVNGKIYIGSTATLGFHRRWLAHRLRLRKNKHWNQHLQNAWNKYGESQFHFEPIEECLSSDCLIREQYYIDTLHPQYNILQRAGSALGYKHTDASKKKIGDACRGENHPMYAGKHIFYHPKYGYFTGNLFEFGKKFNIRENTGYRLQNKELDKSHGWIYIGKEGTQDPENINDFYYNRIHNNRNIYSFYHKTHGIFDGVIPDFMKKYNIHQKNNTVIQKLIRGNRKMAWGWIFLGEGTQQLTFDVQSKYTNAMKQNSKANSRMDIIYNFINIKTNDYFTGSLRDLIKTYSLNTDSAKEMVARRKPHLKGWTIKN